jgi:peptidoglycan/LPS O-acetylase OafA/YrhL
VSIDAAAQALPKPQYLHRIPRLDGLRGVAILAVLLRHFGFAYPVNGVFDRVVSTVLLFGWSGVDLFFVLSGFLITGILIETRNANNYFGSFWARRALRIVPVYFAFLSVWFLVLPRVAPRLGLHAHFGEQHWLPYWTWTANLFGSVPQLGHLWSLSVEEQFYLIWPLVVWLLPNRSVGVLCVALALICPAIRALLLSVPLEPSWPWQLFARADSLAYGALAAVVTREETWRAAAARWWKPGLIVVTVGAVVVLIALGDVDLHANHTPLSAIGFSLIGIAFGAALVGVVLSPSTSSEFRWLDRPWLQALGKYSYGLYLFHGPLAHISMHALPGSRWWPWLSLRPVYFGFMATCIALSFAAAYASWHLFEKRFLSLKDRFAARVVGEGPTPGEHLLDATSFRR